MVAALPMENRWLFLLSVPPPPDTEALEPLLVSWTFLAEDGVFGSPLPPSSCTLTANQKVLEIRLACERVSVTDVGEEGVEHVGDASSGKGGSLKVREAPE